MINTHNIKLHVKHMISFTFQRLLWSCVLIILVALVQFASFNPHRAFDDIHRRQKVETETNITILEIAFDTDANITLSAPTRSQNNDTILTFIRIPKTGSSSMLAFLRRFTGLLSLDHAIPKEILQTTKTGVQWTSGCMFGYFQTPHNASNAICAHVTLEDTRQEWNDVQELKRNGTAEHIPSKMDTFTMVRNPFDLLRSFFYMRREYNITHGNTEEQYELVKSGDFPGWLELMHTQDEQRKTLFQYEFFNRNNVDEAIALIEGDTPNVTVLLNECYEESLRYMQTRYAMFKENAVDDFLSSGWFHSRKGNNIVQDSSESELREKAKGWFVDEYKFYDAAVQQFQRQLLKSGIDLSSIRNPCFLGESKHEDQ